MKTLLFTTLFILLAAPAWADTETLRPNAAGDETNVEDQDPGTGYHWDKVDEVTADDYTTVIWSDAIDGRDLYNLPASSGSGTIDSVVVYASLDRDLLAARVCGAYISIKSGSTISENDVGDPGDTFTFHSYTWSTNPDDSAAWEWADIDDLQIGVRLCHTATNGSTNASQVYCIVYYTPSSGWTGTIMGVTNPAKVGGIDVENIASIGGI